MKAMWCYIGIGCVAICLAGVLLFLPGRGIRTKTVRSFQLMQNIYLDVNLLEQSDLARLVRSTDGMTNSLLLNRTLGRFLTHSRYGWETNTVGMISADGTFLDAWGSPLCFASTNENQLSRELLKNVRLPFVFWSAGPNMTNELGLVDDLFVHGH